MKLQKFLQHFFYFNFTFPFGNYFGYHWGLFRLLLRTFLRQFLEKSLREFLWRYFGDSLGIDIVFREFLGNIIWKNLHRSCIPLSINISGIDSRESFGNSFQNFFCIFFENSFGYIWMFFENHEWNFIFGNFYGISVGHLQKYLWQFKYEFLSTHYWGFEK